MSAQPASTNIRQERAPENQAGDTDLTEIDIPIAAFGLVEPGQGWVLRGNELLRSVDLGQGWQNVSPSALKDANAATVTFENSSTGWMMLQSFEGTQGQWQLLKTQNGGLSWQEVPTDLQEQIRRASSVPVQSASLQCLNDTTCWLLLKEATSQNFSKGSLLRTQDGGRQWQVLKAPEAEPFIFSTPSIGFMRSAGNPSMLYQTLDGGASWTELKFGDLISTNEPVSIQALPQFNRDGKGFLSVTSHSVQGKNIAQFFETEDNGQTWRYASAETEISLEEDGSPMLFTLGDKGEIKVWSANSSGGVPVLSPTGEKAWPPFELQLESLTAIDENVAWGYFRGGGCATEGDKFGPTNPCSISQVLALTQDGGQTWRALQFPESSDQPALADQMVETDALSDSADFPQALFEIPLADPSWVQQVANQGFDVCELPSVNQMQTWFNASPYETVNLYIGGIARLCDNNSLNAPVLSQLFSQGWRFIPTWVGPQAPCSAFIKKFSADPTEARQQGIENANEAVVALNTLGLTNANGSGSIVYYDLEYFEASGNCKAAVTSFLSGWTTRLHELGTYSGVYSTSSTLSQNQIYAINPPPDAAWIAEWYRIPGYRPNETVWNLLYLSNNYWINHQRVYQYSGDHSETWGNVTFGIDNDVLDGPVAAPYNSDLIAPQTAIAVSGTMGVDPWYKSPVQVTFSATDNLAGPKFTYYRLNNNGWQVYNAPFVISSSGKQQLTFFSTDRVNNKETPQIFSFYVDTLPPQNPTSVDPGCAGMNGLPQGLCNDPNLAWSGASDGGTGLSAYDTYEYYWGPSSSATSGNFTSATTYDPPPVAANTPTYLRIRTQDRNGNWSAWQTLFTFIYDPNMSRFSFLPLLTR